MPGSKERAKKKNDWMTGATHKNLVLGKSIENGFHTSLSALHNSQTFGLYKWSFLASAISERLGHAPVRESKHDINRI